MEVVAIRRAWQKVFFLPTFIVWKIWKSNYQLKQWVFFTFTCQLSGQLRFWVWNFLSPNHNKLVVQCAWNRKISQNVRNLFFFWKNRRFFLRKTWILSKTSKVANLLWNTHQFFCENSLFHFHCETFEKIKVFYNLEKLQILWRKDTFLKKKRFHPSKRHL